MTLDLIIINTGGTKVLLTLLAGREVHRSDGFEG